jgi:iron complex transport system ATP-binding protein
VTVALVKANNLSFKYREADIFSNISFAVGAGEVFCLLGPNGCGKTTLLDCILGLHQPYRGQIMLNGINVRNLPREQVARQVSYVPQNHEKAFPYTVMDVVLMGRAAYIGLFDSPSEEDVQIAKQALAMVGILGLKDRCYTELSGGEVQLVMIARALTQKTPLIVMDEPTAHLDYKHELTIMEIVVKLVRETGLSVLMATHFPNHSFYFENSGINTRVALMKDAKFLAMGRPSQVFTEENLQRLYSVNTKIMSCQLDEHTKLRQVIPVSTMAQ